MRNNRTFKMTTSRDVPRRRGTRENLIAVQSDHSSDDSLQARARRILEYKENRKDVGESSNARHPGRCNCDGTNTCTYPTKCKDMKQETNSQPLPSNTVYEPYRYNGIRYSWGDPYGPMFYTYPPRDHVLDTEYGSNPPAAEANAEEEDAGYYGGTEAKDAQLGNEGYMTSNQENIQEGIGDIHYMGINNSEEEEEEEEEEEGIHMVPNPMPPWMNI